MSAIPHARTDPPWSGPSHLMRDGALYAFPAAGRALALYFDRDQNRHAATVFNGDDVGAEYVWCDRRFDVVRVAVAQARPEQGGSVMADTEEGGE